MELIFDDQVCVPEDKVSLAEGFVYLKNIDPTIKHKLAYYYSYNFIGRNVKGYERDVVVLTEEAAINLAKAQAIFNQDGYMLVVLDAYRPVRACEDFIEWGRSEEQQTMKPYFYPNIDKIDAFKEGYVAKRSPHCRGSTVDVTLIQYHKDICFPPILVTKILSNNKEITYYDDGTLDMGSPFDYFDSVSHTNCQYVTSEAKKNRKYLVDVMSRFNFFNTAEGWGDDPKEWWHFTLDQEPFPNKYFDFVIK